MYLKSLRPPSLVLRPGSLFVGVSYNSFYFFSTFATLRCQKSGGQGGRCLLIFRFFFRLSININYLCLFFHSLSILTDFLTPSSIKFNKNLALIYFNTPHPPPTPPHPRHPKKNLKLPKFLTKPKFPILSQKKPTPGVRLKKRTVRSTKFLTLSLKNTIMFISVNG